MYKIGEMLNKKYTKKQVYSLLDSGYILGLYGMNNELIYKSHENDEYYYEYINFKKETLVSAWGAQPFVVVGYSHFIDFTKVEETIL